MDAPRSAKQSDFPYGHAGGRVCYFEMHDGALAQARYRDDLRGAVRRALAGESAIFAAWPGTYRTDLFVIDDLPALAEQIGLAGEAS